MPISVNNSSNHWFKPGQCGRLVLPQATKQYARSNNNHYSNADSGILNQLQLS